jgi:hypothetical protein
VGRRTEGENGALGGEDEDGGGKELGDGDADSIWVGLILTTPHREPPHARVHRTTAATKNRFLKIKK